MDIRSLRYFIETVKRSSFTRAAEEMHVTQSTISKMVHQLEEEMGTALLVRDGRRLALTDTGHAVFERGQEVLSTMRRLAQEVHDIRTLRQGRLSVGMPPMINVLFTPVVKAFRKRHPDIELALTEDTGQAIERQVAAGALEIGMTVLPHHPDLQLETLPVASYPIWALGMPGTFRKEQSAIGIRALRDTPLVLLNDDFALTRALLREFDEAGVKPKIAAQSGQWDWVVAMASAGLGVALLPEPFIHRIAGVPVEAVRLIDPHVSWDVVQVLHGGHRSHAALAWLEVCRDVLG